MKISVVEQKFRFFGEKFRFFFTKKSFFFKQKFPFLNNYYSFCAKVRFFNKNSKWTIVEQKFGVWTNISILGQNFDFPPKILNFPTRNFQLYFKLSISANPDSDRSIEPRIQSATDLAATVGARSKTKIIDRTRNSATTLSDKAMSDFELAELRRELIIARYNRDQELSKISKRVTDFDNDVHTLYVYKVKFDIF